MKKINNKGYMLIEVILAFAIAFGVMFFVVELTVKLKNKNDDNLVETIVATDQAIIENMLYKVIYDDPNSFDCEKLIVDDNMISYGNNTIKISEYAVVDKKYCNDDDKYKIIINIPISVKQLYNRNFDININYSKNSISNLSDNLTDGLYRYQGSYTDVTNNYICFGTNDKNTCISNSDTYMYRIIGIDEIGKMKVIKKTPLSNAMQFHSSNSNYKLWGNTDLYSAINNAAFLNNTSLVPSDWIDRIATVSWKQGQINYNQQIANPTGTGIYSLEDSLTSSVSAKIGIMNMSDYYLAAGDNYDCSNQNGSDYVTCGSSWIHAFRNVNSPSSLPSTSDPTNQKWEWIMITWGNDENGTGWYGNGIYGSTSSNDYGYVSHYYGAYRAQRLVRPVFYLNNNEYITSGIGTIDNPYVLG